jgi:hypothetical protein
MRPNLALACAYFEREIGKPLDEVPPIPLSGWDVVTALWPLNDVFRPHIARIRTVRYEARFEPDANAAIEAFAGAPVAETWSDLSAGTWRVLLERHQQMLVVAMANERAGNPVTVMPPGLSATARLAGAMLLLLHSMKLPFPLADRSQLELPEGSPPAPLRSQ